MGGSRWEKGRNEMKITPTYHPSINTTTIRPITTLDSPFAPLGGGNGREKEVMGVGGVMVLVGVWVRVVFPLPHHPSSFTTPT